MLLLAVIAVGSVDLPVPVPEPDGSPAAQELTLSPAELFVVADTANAAGDLETAEAAYRALADNPNVEIRSEARFRFGMMLSRAQRYREAALMFRAILDERPDAARVRVELARVLALMGDEPGAARSLRQAQAAGLPDEVALVVDQFAAALRARRPYGASLSLALTPDSNINRATDSETLDTVLAPIVLSEDARSSSGVGQRLTGHAFARLPVDDRLTLVPRLSGQGEFYRKSRFNDISASFALGAEWYTGRERLEPSVARTLRFYGGSLYAETRSASLSWIHPMGRSGQLVARATAARADYRLNDLQDGWLFQLNADYERAFNQRSGGGIGFSANRHDARDPGYATTSASVGLLYWHELGRVTLFASTSVGRLESDARLLLFRDRRREWLYRTSIGGTFRQIKVAGFAPTIRVTVERNVSTVGIYDYRRTAFDFGFARAF